MALIAVDPRLSDAVVTKAVTEVAKLCKLCQLSANFLALTAEELPSWRIAGDYRALS